MKTNFKIQKREKIVITGGAGFIGKNLILELLKNKKNNNLEIHVIDICKNEFTNKNTEKEFKSIFKKEIENKKIFLYKINIINYKKIECIFKDTNTIIHLAAFISSPNSINEAKKCFDTNINGTINIFESARKNNVKNIIFASSAAVYGSISDIVKESTKTNPENPYGLSKYITEEIGKMYSDLYKINIIALRFANVWGPMQHEVGHYAPAIGKFIKQVKNNCDITICGDGLQTRDFIHVSDVTKAIILIKEKLEKDYKDKNIFDYFIVSTKTETKIMDLAKLILKISKNKNSKIKNIEPRIEPRKFVGDNNKLKEFINWTPQKTLESGIKDFF